MCTADGTSQNLQVINNSWLKIHLQSTIVENCLLTFNDSPLDAADLENLKSELEHSYSDLQLKALTKILNWLSTTPGPSQGEYPLNAVGIEEAENEVIELLNLKDSCRRVMVIYGIGGIGKTTLATAVFRRLDLTGYHYCRIDMEKDSKQSDLPPLQEQILSDLFEEKWTLNNCTQGREKLSEAFGKASKPVFLFIDNGLRQADLETLLPIEHLSRLPMKSRILVTTRNLNETDIFGRQGGIQFSSHRVDSLREREAKRLLCRIALGDANLSFHPDVYLDGLLKICGGIPLYLKIVGCQLSRLGNTVSACDQILKYHEEWQRTGFEGGEDHVRESIVDFVYRRLTGPSKEAFLDVTFFYYNWERNEVAEMVGWVQLQELEAAALITTSEEKGFSLEMGEMVKKTKVKVKMHDIVRARGRNLSAGNRIINTESLATLLRDEQKLQQIKGVWLRNDYVKLNLEAKHVDLMSNSLRVLFLGERMRVTGRCHRVFEELRFLDISYEDVLPIDVSKSRQLVFFHGHLMKVHRFPQAKFPIPVTANYKTNQILQLPESLQLLYLDHPWDSPVSLDIEHLISLRELQLSNIALVNFETCISHLKSLHSLILTKCGGFSSIPESFGNLSCLQIFRMVSCSMLERLPDSFGNLSSLKKLYIFDWFRLERLPESFGNLSSMQLLDISNCSMLQTLPESFGNLSSIQYLNMKQCSMLERLPQSFGNLSSMLNLNMSYCSMLKRLPESFGDLSSMLNLNMIYCSMLKRLPESFGNLSSTQYLYMKHCSMLEGLPESFGNLSSMRSLDMSNFSTLETLPESFGNLSSMLNLNMSYCSKLESLPESFGNLSSMLDLNMNGCSELKRLPESFGNLFSMHYLYMKHCSILEGLPEGFGNLSSMQRLDMSNCSMLKRLPESFGKLSSMRELRMDNCSELERLPDSFGNLSSLQRLYCSDCSKLETLPESFGNLSSLQILLMRNCSKLERLPQTFDQLSCLQALELDGCHKMSTLFYNFKQLKCLKFLSISHCQELKRLPDNIVCSTSLAAMKAYGCSELEAKAMDSLVEIRSLMFLEMGESPMLIRRWEEIQQHRPLIGAALRFEGGSYPYGKYPYGEIMSTMFFNDTSRFLHVDGDGQLAEVASSSFPDVGVKVSLLFTAGHLSNELRQTFLKFASPERQIVYVDVDVEGEAEGSAWVEEREKRIREALVQLPEGSRAWTCPFHKTRLLFAYSLWEFTRYADTWIVGTTVLVDEEGRRKLSHPLEMIFRRDGCDARGVGL